MVARYHWLSVTLVLGFCRSSVAAPQRQSARNVLYIIVDDLRPSLSPYGQKQVHTPNIQRLADTGMVFNRAYCNQAVCSPTRNSFLSGRYPARTKVWNFINHFRQADCGLELPHTTHTGKSVASLWLPQGGAGECCTHCTSDPGCTRWTWFVSNKTCNLFGSSTSAQDTATLDHAVSGPRADLAVATSWNWTSLPQNFLRNGYFTAGTGKIFHTEEGGRSPPWSGPGMPPMQDPPSWTPGQSMANVNAVAGMMNCGPAAPSTADVGKHGCAINASLEGELSPGLPAKVPPLCDKVIGDDALIKLERAKAQLESSGQPFFLAVGYRKPHLPWRFPDAFLQFYPDAAEIDVAEHPTLDGSVPPIAISSFNDGMEQPNPRVAMAKSVAQKNRLAYYAAISWIDHQVGKLLDRLDSLGLASSTIVAIHGDHGWNLGEHGQWQKFTNWETGVRVPLILRDPALPQSHGKSSNALVELVDVYPTLCELAGIPPPPGENLDGQSVAPLLRRPAQRQTKGYALAMYPRCPKKLDHPELFFHDNDCEFVERSLFPFMGISLRTPEWRLTEWVQWDGKRLMPLWDKPVPLSPELYEHKYDLGCDSAQNRCFDNFEDVNVAGDQEQVVANLSKMLHSLYESHFPAPSTAGGSATPLLFG